MAALRGVTIDAAWTLGRENDLGSIRAGKIADFTVLADDPLTATDDALRDIKVIATVYAGKAYPLARRASGAKDEM
jgi:predicted amidohydrolase YtcJ